MKIYCQEYLTNYCPFSLIPYLLISNAQSIEIFPIQEAQINLQKHDSLKVL